MRVPHVVVTYSPMVPNSSHRWELEDRIDGGEHDQAQNWRQAAMRASGNRPVGNSSAGTTLAVKIVIVGASGVTAALYETGERTSRVLCV